MNVDPIELELFKNAIFSIADEMAVTVIRTAYSSVVRDNMDFSTALADRHGRVVAQGLTLAGHLGSIPTALREVIGRYGDGISPEDVFIMNDPYSGGMHLPDIFVFRPIFHGPGLIAFAAAVCHHSDVGGRVAGSNAADSTEIFQEGLRIPPLRLYRSGTLDETLMQVILSNVRLPDTVKGDLHAQLAACRTAERRLAELAGDLGAERVEALFGETIDHAERIARNAIRRLPDGQWSFEDWIDDDGVSAGERVRLFVTVTKKDDHIIADWTGSSRQVSGAINSTLSFTRAATYCAISSVLDGDIPENEGMFRAMEVIAPPGTILNVLPPGACAARGLTGFRILDCAFGALSQMVPNKVFAASDGGPTGISIGGYDQHRKPFVYTEFSSASWGGRPWSDGPDGISNPLSNLSLPSAEVIEASYPLEILACEFVTDTGGPGRYRGGTAIRRRFRFLEDKGTLQVRADRRNLAPYGLYGGLPGTVSDNLLTSTGTDRSLTAKATVPVVCGDIFTHRTAGAGGWGDPLDREPEAVVLDVGNGFVSRHSAHDDYGVVIDATGAVDLPASKALRHQMRGDRARTEVPHVIRVRPGNNDLGRVA